MYSADYTLQDKVMQYLIIHFLILQPHLPEEISIGLYNVAPNGREE